MKYLGNASLGLVYLEGYINKMGGEMSTIILESNDEKKISLALNIEFEQKQLFDFVSHQHQYKERFGNKDE